MDALFAFGRATVQLAAGTTADVVDEYDGDVTDDGYDVADDDDNADVDNVDKYEDCKL